MKMRKKSKCTLTILLIIGLVVWVLSRIPFYTDINQTISAYVYKDGKQTEATIVEVNGSRSNYMFRDKQQFIGTFCIQYYERTCREDMNVSIERDIHMDVQRILYMQNATFPSLELHSKLFINEKMDEFALGFKDGTVVATSDKMYQRYINELRLHE
jgi:hypothetical protein